MNKKNLIEFIFDTDKNNSGISFDKDYSIQEEGGVNNILKNLKQINIFVGANNSGKSRILRAIFKQNNLVTSQSRESIPIFLNELESLIKKTQHASGQFAQTSRYLNLFKARTSLPFWYFNNELVDGLRDSISEIENHFKANPRFFSSNGSPDFELQVKSLLEKNRSNIDSIYRPTEFHKLYIPILRGLRTFGPNGINDDIYRDRTVADYFTNDNESKTKKISTGLSLYKEIREKLLGGHNDRKFIKDYETFLQENFFDNKPVTLVPREKDQDGNENRVVFITFDNSSEKDRAIYSYGDGMQSIICITYPIFSWLSTAKVDNQLLLACIEEPEIYLHPSMQRKLVEVLMTKLSKDVQYFITTHSNHFLDLFSEPEYQDQISIFSVSQNENGTKEVKKETDLSNSIYDLLGAKPSSLLLANKTIWVEGISDRLYLRHAFKLYFESFLEQKKPIENLDYSFIEYAGSNLQHYLDKEEDIDISSITNYKNVFMIADKDDSDSGNVSKKERYSKLKKQLEGSEGKFKITDGREIENYIKPEILRRVWPGLLVEVKHSDYLNEPLPKFLTEKKQTLHISKNSFGSNKKTIAEKIIKEQKKWNDISLEMQKLVKDIIKFASPNF